MIPHRSITIGTDGTIYVGTHGGIEINTDSTGAVYAVNRNGTLEWKYSTAPFTVTASPVIGPDGSVYVGTSAKPMPRAGNISCHQSGRHPKMEL